MSYFLMCPTAKLAECLPTVFNLGVFNFGVFKALLQLDLCGNNLYEVFI